MSLSSNQYNIIFLAMTSFILLISIFKWIDYLSDNNYIVECFTSGSSHTVDLPLTTTYSCQNFCGPTARCSITGQQCFTDIDCPGCQPYSPPLSETKDKPIPGDNDAGKLTVGVTPTYSSLTSGYGTKQYMVSSNFYSKPPQPNYGVNYWINDYNEQKKMFDKRYKPDNLEYMPNYEKRYSLTGDLIEDGPYASNSILP